MDNPEMHVTKGHAFLPVAVSVNGGPSEPFYLCGCGAALSRTLYLEAGDTELYEIHVHCDECAETHPTYVFARMAPLGDRASITAAFEGRMLPTDLDMRNALCANVSETPGTSGISVVEGEVDEDRDVGFYQAKWGWFSGYAQGAAAGDGEAGPGGYSPRASG